MLSGEAQEDLKNFVQSANWVSLHTLDWSRFYRFVIGTHQRNEELLQPSTIANSIREVGPPGLTDVAVSGLEDPEQLAEVYFRAREILKQYDEGPT